MASLLIKNIPPRLHARLKRQAAANRRSLNSETICLLEEAVAGGARAPVAGATPAEAFERTWEEILAKVSPEVAERLRAVTRLRESLAARGVDFEGWMRIARDSRR